MVLLHAILDPKDEVIFPVPYWVSYPEMVKIAGGVPVPVTARDGSFEPTVEEMAEAVGSYTKAVILNSPNNPSGVVYSDEFVAGVVELCEKRGLYLIMDDTYNRLIFDGRTPTELLPLQPRPSTSTSSKLVVINCVSKMYAMTGFRIGWAVGAAESGSRHDQHPVAGDLGASRAVAVGRGGGAQRRAVVDRKPAPDARKQPQRDDDRLCRPSPASGWSSRAARFTASRISAPTKRIRRSSRGCCSTKSAWSPCPAANSAWRATCA